MSDRNFSRRRRGGMRFKPSGGMGPGQAQGQRNERAASEARQEALTGESTTPTEEVFDARHEKEIERAENVAAGLPPDAKVEEATEQDVHGRDRTFRRPHLETPAEALEDEEVCTYGQNWRR